VDVRFAKGHGTENDFVVLHDPDDRLDLTPTRVRTLCDRRRGLGADGVLRVVRSGRLADAALHADTEWFMDYRNADGSLAEMCGNGLRVFARYLADAGLTGDRTELLVGSRTGARHVRYEPDGQITVDMGQAKVGVPATATVDGRAFEGIEVDVGNPHLACLTDVPLETLNLTVPPGHDPAVFPHGVNVEFVGRLPGGPADDVRVEMRVHERGVGETRSCGTGTVAAAVAALRSTGRSGGSCVVRTLGGTLRVSVTADTSRLTGPAVLVARGELDADWWRSIG
jgi:diaminopimelate epimerase